MDPRFPPIEPFESGMLDVGDGQQIYWEACGNPNGKPALYLHGGPGSGASEGQRRFFDPEVYRAVLFDQRGAGRSRPLASEPDVDLSVNTTQHLIADIEALRKLNGADRWTILGLSWGVTLALAYAETYPEHVEALVLGLVTNTTRREVEWITEGVARIFPQEWERFANFVPESLRQLSLVEAYARLTTDPDPEICAAAAREWCLWEDTHVSLIPGYEPNPRYDDPEFRLRFARLVTHYWSQGAFLEEGQLLRDASKLNGIPGVLIHGRYDVSSAMEVPWQLAQRWSTSELQILSDAGHGGDGLLEAIVGALNRFGALSG